MSEIKSLKLLRALFGVLIAGAALVRADVVETTDGSRLVGKITAIAGGKVSLDTDYAGTLTIKQSTVTSIKTDHPVAVRLASGTRIVGLVGLAPTGALSVVGADGTITTTMAKVAAVWKAGETDPAVLALESHWHYEATTDIEGTSGNTNSLSTGAGLKAELDAPNDTLKYYASYDRAVTQSAISTDQFKAGIDYSDNITPLSTWFLRDEGGYDRIMNESFYDVAAFGYGFDLVKTTEDLLTARAGIGYRYDAYSNPLTPIVSTVAGDFELAHDFKNPVWGEISNNIAIVPSFADVADLTITQDSFYQVPLTNPRLKVRLGVSNNYNSEPGVGIDRLDTLYYIRMVYDWGYAP